MPYRARRSRVSAHPQVRCLRACRAGPRGALRASADAEYGDRVRRGSPEPSSATCAAATVPRRFRSRSTAGIVVRAHVRDESVVEGERLVVRGRLVPFDEARNPGEPSRRALALGEGLAGELAGDRVLLRAPPEPRDVRTWSARLRAMLSRRLRTVLREPEATVIAGALWGERGTLPQAIRDDFQATGTVHVLVTAGLHLGVVAGLVLAVLRLARVPRAAAALAAIPCAVAYAWLSGAHLPSQRAAVMVSVALLARACGARAASWNALALAALVVAAIWPAAVTTVSFALSFSCVAAILLFARPLAARPRSVGAAGTGARSARADDRHADRRLAAERGDVRRPRTVRDPRQRCSLSRRRRRGCWPGSRRWCSARSRCWGARRRRSPPGTSTSSCAPSRRSPRCRERASGSRRRRRSRSSPTTSPRSSRRWCCGAARVAPSR